MNCIETDCEVQTHTFFQYGSNDRRYRCAQLKNKEIPWGSTCFLKWQHLFLEIKYPNVSSQLMLMKTHNLSYEQNLGLSFKFSLLVMTTKLSVKPCIWNHAVTSLMSNIFWLAQCPYVKLNATCDVHQSLECFCWVASSQRVLCGIDPKQRFSQESKSFFQSSSDLWVLNVPLALSLFQSKWKHL